MNNDNILSGEEFMAQLKQEKIYVVSDINDNYITVIDIENGNEIKVYVVIDENSYEYKKNSIQGEVYFMNKKDFLNLSLTDNITVQESVLYSNSEKIEIKNNLAWNLLADLYMEEEEAEGMQYRVVEIKDNKIYLTNNNRTGGYFSIYKEIYPDFEVGDIVQRNNKKYYKVKM